MDLAVFGANGSTGRRVVRQALAAGHHVTAVTRKPDEYPLSSPHLDVVAADVTDPEGGGRVLSGQQAVISTFGAPYTLFWRKVVSPFMRNIVGRTLYDDMRRMEEIVRSSSLEWTVVRPAGLFDAAKPTDDYEVAPRRLPGRFTSRADLADAPIWEATEPRHARSIIEVITRSGIPSP